MKPKHRFQAEQLVVGYGYKTIIPGVSLDIPSNKISVIIGPNASGKSTLLKALARLIKPTSGTITLDGQPVGKIPARRLARVLGILPQSPIVSEGISVTDLVGRGRFPHQSSPQLLDEKRLRGRCGSDGNHACIGTRQPEHR